MKLYFCLRYKMILRTIAEFGIHPLIGVLALLLFIIGTSVFILKNLDFGSLIVSSAGIGAVMLTSQKEKNDFLKFNFSNQQFLQIRIIENLSLSLLFALILMVFQHFAMSITLLVTAILLSYHSTKLKLNKSIPTPFYMFPFEFMVGFRRSLLVYIVSVALVIISAVVGNFNLGMFGLALIMFTIISYYSVSEPEFYVWVHQHSSKQFLQYKTIISIKYALLLSSPLVLLLLVFNITQVHIILGGLLLGLLYVITSILGKYAYYPTGLNINQAIGLGVCMLLPPLLLLLIPYFYSKSIDSLTPYLHD